jgi:hypothetical protein
MLSVATDTSGFLALGSNFARSIFGFVFSRVRKIVKSVY